MDFINISYIGTIAGATIVFTTIVQIFKQYVPGKTVIFSGILAVLIAFARQYFILDDLSASGIFEAILNAFVIYCAGQGIYFKGYLPTEGSKETIYEPDPEYTEENTKDAI